MDPFLGTSSRSLIYSCRLQFDLQFGVLIEQDKSESFFQDVSSRISLPLLVEIHRSLLAHHDEEHICIDEEDDETL